MSLSVLRVACAVLLAACLGLIHSFRSSAAGGPGPHHRYTWRNVEIVGGGYVPGIIFSATEPGLVYARTDIGGAYRLDPGSDRWIPLLDSVGWDNWGLSGVDSLATDPVDPDRVYVLAGTYTNSWDPNNGAILRSTDRGRTWSRTDLPFKSGGNMPGRNMGERLMVDPNANEILYLGARSGHGLWKSTDHGVTWNKVTTFPEGVGNYRQDPSDASGYLSDPLGVTWIAFDPRTGTPGHPTQTIYVGVADRGVCIYRTTDGGLTWAPLPGQPTAPAFMAHHGVLASNGMLYLTYNNQGGPYDGSRGDAWKYDTGTGAWTKITPDPSSATNDWFGYGGLAVDAQNPDTVMIAELNRWWPDVNIWRSTNGGASWTAAWDFGAWPNRIFRYSHDISGAPWLTFNDNPSLPVVTPKLGWMVGDLEIDPFDSNRMLYGTGATIYGTDNLTAWGTGENVRISVNAQGLEETAVQDLISPPAGPPLLSALGDIAGFRHDDLAVVPAKMYDNPTTYTTTSLDFAEAAPAKIFRVGHGGRNAGYSNDGGATWSEVTSAPAGARGGTVALSADGSSVVWAPEGAIVPHVSFNHGVSWTPSAGLPAGARVASDRVDAGVVYGVGSGTFYVSRDRGATFAASTATGLPTGSVRVEAVPGFAGHVWLAGSGGGEYGLWVSRDFGTTFEKVDGVDQADTIGFGKPAPGRDYPALYTSAKIRGTRGIFRSDDGGHVWFRINDDAHQYAWTGQVITGDPRVYGRVYVGTNGRGVIYGEPFRGRSGSH